MSNLFSRGSNEPFESFPTPSTEVPPLYQKVEDSDETESGEEEKGSWPHDESEDNKRPQTL